MFPVMPLNPANGQLSPTMTSPVMTTWTRLLLQLSLTTLGVPDIWTQTTQHRSSTEPAGSQWQWPSIEQFPYFPYLVRNPGPEFGDDRRMFQGIPSVVVTPCGRIWATWYGGGVGEGPENYVMLTSSRDGGRTWSDLEMVIAPPFRASEPALWLDPDGRMWFMWNQYPLHLRSRGSQLWAMTTKNPDAVTPDWSAPRLLAMELNNLNKPTVLSNRTWLWPTGSWQFGALPENYRHMPPPLGTLSRPLLSKDKGQTFLAGGHIPMRQEYRAFEEYQVVQRKDGSLWLLTRTHKGKIGNGIGESFSHDGGMTWSEVKPSGIVHTTSRFFISRLRSEKLLLVKNGPVGKDTGRSELMAFLSDDDGATWYGGLMLDERKNVAYPDAMQGIDGQIYVIYDHSRHREKEILLAIFSEKDVARGKVHGEESRLKIIVNKARGFNPDRQSHENN